MNDLSRLLRQLDLAAHAHSSVFKIAGLDASMICVALLGIALNILMWTTVRNKLLASGRAYSVRVRALPYFGVFMALMLVVVTFAFAPA